MAGWGGFTDEELQKVKEAAQDRHDDGSIKSSTSQPRKAPKPATLGQGGRKTPREKVFKALKKERENETESREEGVEPAAVTPEKPKQERVENSAKSCDGVQLNLSGVSGENKEKENQGKVSNKEETNLPDGGKEQEVIRLLSNEETANLELSTLEELQIKQKQIEEENKKRKKLIKETLQERYKRAQSETQTLQTINKELGHLDQLLATDVEILRSRIEEATIDFAHAKRRYDKAEKEYVDAKLNLQLKSDKKDDLIQHLYSIIKENEERKAKKLEDLMAKLNLQQNEQNPTKS